MEATKHDFVELNENRSLRIFGVMQWHGIVKVYRTEERESSLSLRIFGVMQWWLEMQVYRSEEREQLGFGDFLGDAVAVRNGSLQK